MYNYDDFLRNNYVNGIYNNENTLETIYEGYSKGNAFKNLYDPYKNYKVRRPTPRNEEEDLLLKLNAAAFYAHEINLLLDVYPDNREMLAKFNEYRNLTNNLMNEYESKYGALNIKSDVLNKAPWGWDQESFPWDKGGRS